MPFRDQHNDGFAVSAPFLASISERYFELCGAVRCRLSVGVHYNNEQGARLPAERRAARSDLRGVLVADVFLPTPTRRLSRKGNQPKRSLVPTPFKIPAHQILLLGVFSKNDLVSNSIRHAFASSERLDP